MIADKGCIILLLVFSIIPIFLMWCIDDKENRPKNLGSYMKMYMIQVITLTSLIIILTWGNDDFKPNVDSDASKMFFEKKPPF